MGIAQTQMEGCLEFPVVSSQQIFQSAVSFPDWNEPDNSLVSKVLLDTSTNSCRFNFSISICGIKAIPNAMTSHYSEHGKVHVVAPEKDSDAGSDAAEPVFPDVRPGSLL